MSLNFKVLPQVGCIILKPTNKERFGAWLSLNHGVEEKEEVVSLVFGRRNGIESNVSGQLPC